MILVYYATHYARCQANYTSHFNASQKRNQSFSRKNDRSRALLYLRVPVLKLQHKCIRNFELLWIDKPSVCTVSERKINFSTIEIQFLIFLWKMFEYYDYVIIYIIFLTQFHEKLHDHRFLTVELTGSSFSFVYAYWLT